MCHVVVHIKFDNPPYIYFIQIGGTGPIKIGYGKDPVQRLRIAQVYNPSMLKLLAVEHGGKSLEQKLHKKFSKSFIYGEWFLPNDDLLQYIQSVQSVQKVDVVCEDFRSSPPRGELCHNWKGEEALPSSKRQRSKRRYKKKDKCEKCGRIAKDIYHIDGSLDNNSPENLLYLCRRCRMEADGTLQNFVSIEKKKKPDRPCRICETYTNNFWYGRCHTCQEFYRRNGFERSEKKPHKPKPCSICDKETKYLAKSKCHSCYEFYRRNGFDRNELDRETDDIILLKDLSYESMSFEKASIIRTLYVSNRFTNKFIAKSAGISTSYFNDIVRNRYFIDAEYTYIPNRKR